MALDWRHIRLLCAAHVHNTMTGGRGITFLILFAILGAVIALVILSPLSQLADLAGASFQTEMAALTEPVLGWWIDAGGNDARVKYLLHDNPAMVSAILVVLTGFMPFVTVAASANQLSRDITNKGLRYMLLRTERINILLSRFLGSWFIVSAATLVLVLAVGVYSGLSFESVGLLDALTWSLRGWFALTWVALPYVALCTLISCVIPVPAASGILAFVLAGVTPILLTRLASDFGTPWLPKISPWAWKYRMLDPAIGDVALTAGLMVVFALIPLVVAIRFFGKRNL